MTDNSTEANRDLSDFLLPSVFMIYIYMLFHTFGDLDPFYSWLSNWGSVLGAVGSVMMTGLLALLYYFSFKVQGQQMETMRTQADAMKEQLDWMEGQQKPDIWVRDFESYSGHIPPIAGEQDYIAAKLANEGTGSAKNLYTRCDIWLERDGNQRKLVKTEDLSLDIDGQKFTIKPHRQPLLRAENWNFSMGNMGATHSQRLQGDILHPEESQWFFSEVTLMVHPENDNGRSYSFQDVIDLLWAAGVDQICFQVTLLYRDPAGNLDGERLLSANGDLANKYTLESFHPFGGFSGAVDPIVQEERENDRLYP